MSIVDIVHEAIDRITAKNVGKYPFWNSIDEKFFAMLYLKWTKCPLEEHQLHQWCGM